MSTYEVHVCYRVNADTGNDAVNTMIYELDVVSRKHWSIRVNPVSVEDQVKEEPFSGKLACRKASWCVLEEGHQGTCSATGRRTFASETAREVDAPGPLVFETEDKEHPRK